MRFPAALPYVLIGAVIVMALVAWIVIDSEVGWLIPVSVIPLAVVYLLIDRAMKRRQEEGDVDPGSSGR